MAVSNCETKETDSGSDTYFLHNVLFRYYVGKIGILILDFQLHKICLDGILKIFLPDLYSFLFQMHVTWKYKIMRKKLLIIIFS